MRNNIRAAVLLTLLCLFLGGCAFWADGFYVSDEPYQVQNAHPVNEMITAGSYMDIRDALAEMVEDCTLSAIISVPNLEHSMVNYYMEAVIHYIMENNPIGAYGVQEITYEIGTNAGETAIAVDISYNYSRSVILRMKRTQNMDSAFSLVKDALNQYAAGITLYVSNYTETDITQMIQDYVDAYPEICMEMPQVSVAVYPNQGIERVVDITFSYRNSREVLRSMQKNVDDIFTPLQVSGETLQERYASLYDRLIKMHTYTLETSITPAYSLLRHGVGDSKAFATVYAAMCRKVGLVCHVISGTRAGEAWYWNVVESDGTYYHLDLLQCSQNGGFQLLGAIQMTGYVWDYSAFPIQIPEETTQPTELSEGTTDIPETNQ